jgi:hypothetical protein
VGSRLRNSTPEIFTHFPNRDWAHWASWTDDSISANRASRASWRLQLDWPSKPTSSAHSARSLTSVLVCAIYRNLPLSQRVVWWSLIITTLPTYVGPWDLSAFTRVRHTISRSLNRKPRCWVLYYFSASIHKLLCHPCDIACLYSPNWNKLKRRRSTALCTALCAVIVAAWQACD